MTALVDLKDFKTFEILEKCNKQRIGQNQKFTVSEKCIHALYAADLPDSTMELFAWFLSTKKPLHLIALEQLDSNDTIIPYELARQVVNYLSLHQKTDILTTDVSNTSWNLLLPTISRLASHHTILKIHPNENTSFAFHPIPYFFANGYTSLETGNGLKETLYKLDRADWGVCDYPLSSPISAILWVSDGQFVFGPPRKGQYRLKFFTDIDDVGKQNAHCLDPSWYRKRVQARHAKYVTFPGRFQSLDTGQFADCRNGINFSHPSSSLSFKTTRLKIQELSDFAASEMEKLSSLKSVSLVTVTPPISCNFYIGIGFAAESFIFPIKSHLGHRFDNALIHDLYSPDGYLMGSFQDSHSNEIDSSQPEFTFKRIHPNPDLEYYGGLDSLDSTNLESSWKWLVRKSKTIYSLTGTSTV